MRAIDTGIVMRFLLADDAGHYDAACTVMREDVSIPWTVLLEVFWLFSSRYAMPRSTVAGIVRALVDLPNVHVPDSAFVGWAMGRFEAGADFVDMMHLAGARDATVFATFDRRIARHAGPDAPVPIETLSP